MNGTEKTTIGERLALRQAAMVAALGGCFVAALGLVFYPDHFFGAYLAAFNFWLGVSLGCMALLMIQHLTGGAWGLASRRILEAASRLLPLMALLFLPIALDLSRLYIWTDRTVVEANEHLLHKSAYLQVPWFLGRAAIYFAVWLVLSYLLNRWSEAQDAGHVRAEARHMRIASGLGLVLYGLTATFAAVDWIMSLEPLWYSTMFPPLYAVGQMLEGMAFTVIAVIALKDREPFTYPPHVVRLRDFGNLLLTFVMFWAYLSFSQFMLIWAENLPEEIPWYQYRLRGHWQWVALALVVLQFSVPFVLLLFRDVKDHGRRLAAVAAVVLVMRYVDLVWWIEGSFGGLSWRLLIDVAAWIGLGGIWMWIFLGQLQRRPLLPLADPQWPALAMEEAKHE